MSRASRSVFSAAIAAAVLMLAAAIQLVTTLDVRLTDPPAEREEYCRNLEVMSRISDQRFEAVDEFMAGRRSLIQTAEWFRQLAAECPFDVLPHLRNLHPDLSDDDLYCLHVLMHIEANRNRWDRAVTEQRLMVHRIWLVDRKNKLG